MNFSAKMQDQGAYYALFNNKQPFQLNFSQFMRVSFFIIILLCTTLQLLFAVPVRGQDMTVEKVTVSLEQEELTAAFKQIEQQTTLRFFYRKSDVSKLSKRSLSPARRTIERTLFELLHNTGFTFRQVDQNILIETKRTFQDTPTRISGQVLALDNRQPLPFATVELLRSTDLQIAGQAMTDDSGRFEITTKENYPFLIRVSLIGYHVYRAPVKNDTEITLPAIYLEPDPKELNEVTVAARSPLVKQEVDRLVYNVQADPDVKTSTALEMLAKVPLVSVDPDGNIRLKGSSSFKVLIDGRSSAQIVNDPKEIFRVMPASSIAGIEVITIPPAKYDSEGLAGIINIITVRKKLDGYNGNLSFHYKAPNGPRSSAGFTLKSGKFAIAVLGGYNVYNTPQTPFSHYRENTSPKGSTINQQGEEHTENHQSIIYSQFSYEIDSLTQIAGIINYSAGSNHQIDSVLTTETGDTFSSYQLDNDGRSGRRGYDLSLDYQKGFKRRKTQLLSISYRFSNNNNDQTNQLSVSKQVNNYLTDYSQNNRSGTVEHTMQLDYAQPIKQIMMESGIKAIVRNNFSNYQTTLSNTGNSISYEQDIYAVYHSYQFKLHSWAIKAGARLEMTALMADFSSGGALHTPGYIRVFPAIAAQKKLSKTNSINLGYTERISRPGISQLNPYVDRQNPLSINYGNPYLRPELNHTFSFNYSAYRNNSFNAGISYSFSNHSIQYVSILSADGVTHNTFDNLGKNTTLSGYVSANYSAGKHFSMNINSEIRRVCRAGTIDRLDYKKNALAGSSIVDLNYRFRHDWRSGFVFQYYSPNVTLQSTSSPYYYISFNLAKSMFNKKLNISGSASNPFLKYMNYQIRYTDPHYTQHTQTEIVYRRFNIIFNYAFGKLRDGAVKKNKKSVKNDDTSTAAPPSLPGN